MRKEELTQSQLERIELVTDRLGDAGWNFFDWLPEFEAGDEVWPELFAEYTDSAHVNLYFTYSLEPEYVAVGIQIKDKSDYVEFRVYPVERQFDELLELIVKRQDVMTYSDYPSFVRAMRDICGDVFWEEQGLEGEIVTDAELDGS